MRIEWLKFDDYVPARITKKSLGFVPFLSGHNEEDSDPNQEPVDPDQLVALEAKQQEVNWATRLNSSCNYLHKIYTVNDGSKKLGGTP